MIPTAALPLVLALTLSGASKTVAVVDLSSPKAPSVAEALRRTQRAAMSTSRTNAAVSDAESLGLICSVDDVQCLEKLMVIIKADEVIAFAAAGSQMSVVRIGRGAPQRAKVKMSPSASATAAQALDALERSGSSLPASAKDTTEVIVLDEPTSAGTKDKDATPSSSTDTSTASSSSADTVATSSNAAPAATTSGGVSPALAVAIVGGVIAVGCGTGAIVTSVDLANKLTAAQHGQKPLDQRAYDTGSTVFWLLTACTGVGIAGAGVGGAFAAIE